MLDVTRGRRCIYATLAVATLSLPFGAGAQELQQVAEEGSYEVPFVFANTGAFAGSAEQQFCQPGASWMRVHFNELVLAGNDTFTVQGTEAEDAFVFSGQAFQGRQFFTRSFAGECITLKPQLSADKSRFEIDRIQVGTVPTSLAPMAVAAVGDICGTNCNLTAPLITNLNPNLLLALGDLAYENGSLTEFNNNYAPYYGPFKSFTRPSPGNHEYQTSNAAGYFDYFNGVGIFTGPAGDRDKGYYSFDLGDWHIVSLNSNISMTSTSAQVTWLKQDLQANTKPCTLAYWHHPRFTKGNYNDHTSVQVLYQTLQDNQADIVLAGHDHSYQRYKKMTATGTIDAVNGIRSWVVGVGGRGFYAISSDTRRDAGQANTYGILRLNLDSGNYSWSFVPEAGKTYSDTGSDTCKRATGGNTAPSVTITAPANGSSVAPGTAVSFTGTATDTQDGTLSANLAWTSSINGAIGTGASFSTSSLSLGTHTITAAVTDSGGLSGSASISLTIANPGPVTVTLYSVAAQDGYISESTETSGVGGSGSSTTSSTTSLRVGDTSSDYQTRSIVSFDTSSIPDTATITATTLRLKRGKLTGTSPFTTHGTCMVDMSSAFGGSTTFANGDFEAAAAATGVATMSHPTSNGTFSTGALNATGLGAINKTGTTQFRVYFTLDDNDDTGNDYMGFYSGEAAAGNKPELVITYTP